jgi:LPS sulfotransferase NodH
MVHVINRLYSREFDYPKSRKNKINYMIATLPRSGSTYFAINLWRTGVLGAPMEYFNFGIMPQILQRFGFNGKKPADLGKKQMMQYINLIKSSRTSPNGVFGYKMFMQTFHDLLLYFPDAYSQIQPDIIVFLTRDDWVGQAISYSKAVMTKMWFANDPSHLEASYDYDHIKSSLDRIKIQHDFWEGVFSQAKINPIRISYENLIASSHDVIDDVLREMGMEVRAKELPIPLIEKQSDEVTEEWRSRFLYDHQRSGNAHGIVSTSNL